MVYPKYSGEILKLGSTGENVEIVQTAMNVLFAKYPIHYKLENSGFFCEATEKAVKEIQRAVDLDIDGIVGEKTWNTIIAIASFISP